MTKDPAFRKEAEQLRYREINPMSGEDLQKMIGELGLHSA